MQSAYTKDNFYIVITDFNGFEQTQKCLSALQSSEFQNFTSIVVDHGTNNETQRGIKQRFPNAIVIKASPELWWTGATNTGIKYALDNNASAVMLLNNDCYVKKTTIGSITKQSCNVPNAIIAPIQRDWITQTILSINPRCNLLLGFPTIAGSRKLTKKMLLNDLLPVELIGGGRGTIIPAKVFKKIGLFDENNFPHYCADHDFYMRAKKSQISLFTAVNVSVDIDNSRTSTADKLEQLNLSQFRKTFTSTRSHRNFIAVSALFRKHHPVRSLCKSSIILFYFRHIVTYAARRSLFVILHRNEEKSKHS